jgi:Adenylylsulphate kinase
MHIGHATIPSRRVCIAIVIAAAFARPLQAGLCGLEIVVLTCCPEDAHAFLASFGAISGTKIMRIMIPCGAMSDSRSCKGRDPKGLYAKALAGKVKNFMGIDSPYDPPENADIHLVTENVSADAVVDSIVEYLRMKERI